MQTADTDASPAPEVFLSDPGFGIYVHWPFCLAKCPYCDFNSHVRHGGIDQAMFSSALVRELETMAERTRGRRVASIFFGGGTPSLMTPQTVERLLETVARLWPAASNVEITLEANPTSVEARHFDGYRQAGVNRVSIGIQALNDADLKALGRQHSAAEALDALAIAQRVFDRVSFDLIYARSGQAIADWRDELARGLDFATDHLSLYQLTIEPGTAFAELHARGRLQIPAENEAADFYELTQELCAARGLPAYEISNHARPGAQSRHNLIYWQYGEYVGVGPGAHGRIVENDGRHAISTLRDPEQWHAAVMQDGAGIAEDVTLTAAEQVDEALVMGLRIVQGLDLTRLEALGLPLPDPQRVDELCDLGLLDRHTRKHRLIPTPSGRLVLNRLASALSPD